MANSVDPDQTSCSEVSDWIYTICSDQPIRIPRVITKVTAMSLMISLMTLNLHLK